MKTIEEKAKEYAHVNRGIYVTEKHVEKAYIAGAQEAIASQWRDAKVELPKHRDVAIVIDRYDDQYVAIYNEIYKLWESVETQNTMDGVKYWMPIPELPKSKKGEQA